jgi:hypothetical protein
MSRPKNIAASIRNRLLDENKRRGADFDSILVRFAVERVLARLSRSPFANRFVLKGAMLFAIWSGNTHRPTRDMDLLGFGSSDAGEIREIFRQILHLDSEDDGLVFDPDSVSAQPIRALDGYGGLEVTFQASLDRARISVRVDIGFGDVITPGPETTEFPSLLSDFSAPVIRAYPVYTAFAEKLEATVRLGEANGRMKDFFDLWFIAKNLELDPSQLKAALQANFARRGTAFSRETVLAIFTPAFASLKDRTWRQFLARNQLHEPEGSLELLLARLREYLEARL